MINYFETQLHVPSSQGSHVPPTVTNSMAQTRSGSAEDSVARKPSKPPGALRSAYDEEIVAVETRLTDGKLQTAVTVVDKMMSDEERIAWFAKILDAVRMRYRKLQRFAR